MNKSRRVLHTALALAMAAALWLPCVHLLFARHAAARPPDAGISPQARALAARHLELWTDPQLKRRNLRAVPLRGRYQDLSPHRKRHRTQSDDYTGAGELYL